MTLRSSARTNTINTYDFEEFSEHDAIQENEEASVIGGLQDDDVAITKQSLSGRQRGSFPEVSTCVLITVFCMASRLVQLVTLSYIEPEPTPKPKPKSTRTHKDDVPVARSLSKTSLPKWIADIFDSALVPTSIEYRGSLEDPWRHEPEPPTDTKVPKPLSVRELLQQLLDELRPAENYTVAASDRALRIVSLPAYVYHVLTHPHHMCSSLNAYATGAGASFRVP